MPRKRGSRGSTARSQQIEAGLVSLDRSRGPLFREKEDEGKSFRPDGQRDPVRCQRSENKMRISDLEAIDIARAFSEKPHLRGKGDEVLQRVGRSLSYIGDTHKPQRFDCPLLEEGKCMVHRIAKPIECLAELPDGGFSSDGHRSLERRDQLNNELYGNRWEFKAIPLMLARYMMDREGPASGKSGSTLRKEQNRVEQRRASRSNDPRKGSGPAR
ncbi:MAG: hypothetical protein CMJ95_10300 [Planctomycetes bacterium]|nr:hypothetical protein [Planctomycetota bacterium]